MACVLWVSVNLLNRIMGLMKDYQLLKIRCRIKKESNDTITKMVLGHAFHLYIIQHPFGQDFIIFFVPKYLYTGALCPVHWMPYYQSLGNQKGDFSSCWKIIMHCLSLPIYSSLTERELDLCHILHQQLFNMTNQKKVYFRFWSRCMVWKKQGCHLHFNILTDPVYKIIQEYGQSLSIYWNWAQVMAIDWPALHSSFDQCTVTGLEPSAKAIEYGKQTSIYRFQKGHLWWFKSIPWQWF